MAQVGFQQSQAFPDGLKPLLLGRIVFEFPEVGVGLGSENQFGH
jgi:hypothetical protein